MLLYESGGDDPGETDNLWIVTAAGQADAGIRLSYCFFPGAVLNLTLWTALVIPLAFLPLGVTDKSAVPFICPGESGSFVNRLHSAQNKESIPGFLPGFKLMNRMNTPPSFALDGFLYSVKVFPLAGCWRLVKRKQGQKKRPALFKPWLPMAVYTAALVFPVLQTGTASRGEISPPHLELQAGAQQTLPAVPSLTRVAMGYRRPKRICRPLPKPI